MLSPNISLDTVLRAYNLITKRITRRLYMMLEKPNKDKYLVKYSIFGFTFQIHYIIPNIAFFKKQKAV